VLQGDDDQVCSPTAAAEYVAKIPLAEIVRLPLVGHGFGVERRWGGALDQAFQRLVTAPGLDQTASAGPVSDLPLIEVSPDPGGPADDRFAIMLSGDGGWAGMDRAVSQRLAARGVPVVGLNSLQYFWKTRSPDELGRDLARIIAHYRTRWSRDRVLLLGYSFGADVLPFAIASLPAANRSAVAGVGLLGLGQSASFEFHVAEWIGRTARDEYPTWPALKELPTLVGPAPVACLFGAEETDSGCRASPGVSAIRLPGGHHLGGDFDVLADRLLSVFGAGRP
jgi:type IV secretory pathway VirJ component